MTTDLRVAKRWKPYLAYKDSGAAWLGQIPTHWKVIRADGFLRYQKQQVNPYLHGIVFHYSIPSIQETGDGAEEVGSEIDSAKLLITEESLLVSKLNPRKGTVILARPRTVLTVCSSEFTPLLPTSLCDLRFACYLYLSESVRERISAVVRSATRSHQRAEVSDIVKAWHGLPPVPEQQSIASFLDRETTKIDTLVAKKERLIKLLQEKRAALITHTVTKGLDPTVPMKNSGVEWLGQIPAHWEVKRVKWAAKMESGHTPDKKVEAYWTSCDIPWVSLNDTGYLRDHDYISDTAYLIW